MRVYRFECWICAHAKYDENDEFAGCNNDCCKFVEMAGRFTKDTRVKEEKTDEVS